MSDLYSAAKQTATPVFTVHSAAVNVYIKDSSEHGPWYVTEQEGVTIVVTREELQELVLGYQAILNAVRVEENPNQLRLFDPDNPPEAPGDNRLDSAQ